MDNLRIAAQMYTVREFTKTLEGIYESLKKIKQAGYDAVQTSGLGPIDDHELKAMTDELGLTICATHVGYDDLKDRLDAVIAQHKLWNCKYVGLGAMPFKYKDSAEGFKTFAREASQIAKALNESGLKFIYHNHSFEFVRFDGVCGMDILLNECAPEVGFEIDTYWVQHGGADPIQWIRKVKGRMDVVHFKDMVVEKADIWVAQAMAEVGEGNLNWQGIIEACKETGVKWAAVEQDVCKRDPFESLAMSRQYLKKMGL